MTLTKTPTRVGCTLALLLGVSQLGAQEAAPSAPAKAPPKAPTLDAAKPPAAAPAPVPEPPTSAPPESQPQPARTEPPSEAPPGQGEAKPSTGVPGFTSAPLPAPAHEPAASAGGQARVIQVGPAPSAYGPLRAGPGSVEDDPEDDTDYYQEPLGRHQDHWFAWIGGRSMLVRDARFDMFATDDTLSGLSLGLGRVLASSQRLSGGAFVTWDISGRGSDVRGDDTSLLVQKVLLGGEARYHLHHRWYAFARVGAGLGHVGAEIDSRLTNATSSSSSNEFATDLKAGTALELAGPADGSRRTPRVWLSFEGGYTYLTESTLSFAPEAEKGPERAQPLNAGELSLSGLAFGVSLVGSY